MIEIYVSNCCALFYRSSGLAVSCYNRQGGCEVSYPLEPERTVLSYYNLNNIPRNPDVFLTPSQGFYGCITLPDGCHVIVGPAYNVPYSDELVRSYMQENFIAADKQEAAEQLLLMSPTIGYAQFLDKVTFLHYCLNGEIIDPTAHFAATRAEPPAEVRAKNLQDKIDNQEQGSFHNTYEWEQAFYASIRSGDEEKLLAFLQESVTGRFQIGVMAGTPLRQARNLLIGSVTKFGMLAAIPAGLDAELTYQLIDSYALECERAATVAEIDRLYSSAALDFCSRIGGLQLPEGISREVYQCMCFIRNHTNEHISLSDVADAIGRSVSYTGSRFRAETGSSIGAYITRCKLEDAVSLLLYSEKSLAEISNYLCFSSQSYFQNLFKKQYGVTPMQYRRNYSSINV